VVAHVPQNIPSGGAVVLVEEGNFHSLVGSDSFLARPACPPTEAKFRRARVDVADSLIIRSGSSGSNFLARLDFLVPWFLSPGILLMNKFKVILLLIKKNIICLA
jgi:hypothetical protein